jgi:hypothetical protein
MSLGVASLQEAFAGASPHLSAREAKVAVCPLVSDGFPEYSLSRTIIALPGFYTGAVAAGRRTGAVPGPGLEVRKNLGA